ncbi:MAG: hypothetical protein AAF268_15185 [Cyanobacteria bacterium P01_A01_bin.3]
MPIASMQGSARLVAEASTIALNGRSCTVIRYASSRGTGSTQTGSTHHAAHHPTDDYYTWQQIADLLSRSPPFRRFWNRTLATPNTLAPQLEEYQWKPVPIHPSTTDRPFFAILVPARFATANPTAYQSHFSALPPDRRVAVFPNLSGASTLVSPTPDHPAEEQSFGHLADFCSIASPELAAEFWQQIGTLALECVRNYQRAWCNTHGHGVPWLHVRFDSTHKYASFPPYGAITSASQQDWYTLYDRAFRDR